MVNIGYKNNAIRNQKKTNKPIADGNAVDSGITDKPLPCWKLEKEWKFKCGYWIKKLISCCVSQNIAKYKLTAYLMYICYLFSYLYNCLNRYWANQLDIFITTSTKTAIFIATHLKKHMAYHY